MPSNRSGRAVDRITDCRFGRHGAAMYFADNQARFFDAMRARLASAALPPLCTRFEPTSNAWSKSR